MIDQFLVFISAQFATNEIFSGALLAGIGLGLLNECKTLPKRLYELWKKKFITRLTIDSQDDLYEYLQQLINDAEFYKNNRRFRMVSKTDVSPSKFRIATDGSAKQSSAFIKGVKILLVPYNSSYLFRYKGKWVYVKLDRNDNPTGDSYNPILLEKFSISYLGSNSDFLIDFCNDLRERYENDNRDSLKVNTYTKYGWTETNNIREKSFDTIVLSPEQKERIIDAVQKFEESEEWYLDRSVPYHMGMLFYGAPGTGKTSLVHAIASSTKRSIYYMSLGNEDVRGNNDLNAIMSDIDDDKAILLLEDVDHDISNQTFSGLLNTLDGMLAKHGLIVIMTTNHVDRLPKEMLRPGRIDHVEHIDACDEYQIKQLFKKFIPDGDADKFYEALPDVEIVPSELQVYLMKHQNAEDAIANVVDIKRTIVVG